MEIVVEEDKAKKAVMGLAKKVVYNEAIRDRIPEIIRGTAKTPVIQVIEDRAEHKKYLEEKLDEELTEYKESGKVEELADLVEVVYGILDMSGVSIDEFEGIRKEKNDARGAFKDRLFLVEVEG